MLARRRPAHRARGECPRRVGRPNEQEALLRIGIATVGVLTGILGFGIGLVVAEEAADKKHAQDFRSKAKTEVTEEEKDFKAAEQELEKAVASQSQVFIRAKNAFVDLICAEAWDHAPVGQFDAIVLEQRAHRMQRCAAYDRVFAKGVGNRGKIAGEFGEAMEQGAKQCEEIAKGCKDKKDAQADENAAKALREKAKEEQAEAKGFAADEQKIEAAAKKLDDEAAALLKKAGEARQAK
jgi:hypothetical protein